MQITIEQYLQLSSVPIGTKLNTLLTEAQISPDKRAKLGETFLESLTEQEKTAFKVQVEKLERLITQRRARMTA